MVNSLISMVSCIGMVLRMDRGRGMGVIVFCSRFSVCR